MGFPRPKSVDVTYFSADGSPTPSQWLEFRYTKTIVILSLLWLIALVQFVPCVSCLVDCFGIVCAVQSLFFETYSAFMVSQRILNFMKILWESAVEEMTSFLVKPCCDYDYGLKWVSL